MDTEDSISYAFHLFAPSQPSNPPPDSKPSTTSITKPTIPPTVQHIKLSPQPTSLTSLNQRISAQSEPPQRPAHHYFANPTPAQRARYKAAAIEPETVQDWAKRPCRGLECEWRIVQLEKGSDRATRRVETRVRGGAGVAVGVRKKGFARGLERAEVDKRGRRLDVSIAETEDDDSAAHTAEKESDRRIADDLQNTMIPRRKRLGKKTRIKLRVRLRARAVEEAAAAEKARQQMEEESRRSEKEAQAAKEKEEVLRKRRRALNRRKQLKKREREKEKARQLGTADEIVGSEKVEDALNNGEGSLRG